MTATRVVCSTSALALLASVLVGPLHTPGEVHALSWARHLWRHCAVPATSSPRHTALPAINAKCLVKAVRSEERRDPRESTRRGGRVAEPPRDPDRQAASRDSHRFIPSFSSTPLRC